jgi:hypothetical protein
MCRRVELVLLHDSDADPKGTLAWLQPRPQLQRHHHIRLANDKVTAVLMAPWLMYSTAAAVAPLLCLPSAADI